ncbi:MAG: hypothetical protein AVDCRST_MAG77-6167 [uncultured Chloroflexi bacterium]|uniref:Uncharacterized protein n=1 Tax=uncultured Chloroflexota bacterium TaxID=166587 RepID=A0A6J4KKR2_9CHLR|nr:MAG: hypothetical protein AVDCRST_MAG77-6167 [uncultured Chloroflexota bacterium]
MRPSSSTFPTVPGVADVPAVRDAPSGRRRRASGGRPPTEIQRALRRSRWRLALEWLRPRWLSLLGAVACFGGAIGVLLWSDFRVEQVTVRRESASSEEAVTRATQLSQVVGRNIFLVSSQLVAQEVVSIPSVRWARVVPRFPNVVEIEIVERTPIATWQAANGAFLVDDQGYVMAELPPGERPAAALLPVRDTSGFELRVGDQVSQRALLAARELVKAMPAAGVRARDVELGPTGLVFTTEAGWRVIFGETEGLNAKLANLAAVAEMAQQRNLKIAVLDLRPKDRPFYQLAP